MSYISTDSDITEPRFSQAWRAERDGSIHATVYLSTQNATMLSFGDPADARAVAAACAEAAEAMDRLAGGGQP